MSIFGSTNDNVRSQLTFLVTAASSGLVSSITHQLVFRVFYPEGNFTFVNLTTNTSFSLNSGTMFSPAVSAGDIFGFQLSFSDDTNGSLTLSNFFAPEGAPRMVCQNRLYARAVSIRLVGFWLIEPTPRAVPLLARKGD